MNTFSLRYTCIEVSAAADGLRIGACSGLWGGAVPFIGSLRIGFSEILGAQILQPTGDVFVGLLTPEHLFRDEDRALGPQRERNRVAGPFVHRDLRVMVHKMDFAVVGVFSQVRD